MKTKEFKLTKNDLIVRTNIIKLLSTVDLLTTYGGSKVEGELTFKSKNIGFKGEMSSFSEILESIYEYNKTEGSWKFILGGVTINFVLN